ncbi:T9SS type B sorting domain-containing protein [Gaetbulibacter aquiaggeris]|uniref:T9SS type B sorting domain-containing protein n=1 Tax=Gaetbulibacter aquiaggeris TaxID=1735373 RepID=A0ABW7MPK4_9FLAO
MTSLSFSQLSKTHFIPPLTNAEFGNANPEEQYIYISTPSPVSINYTIKPMGQPTSNYITGIVSNTNPREIYVGTGNGQLFIPSSITSTVVNDRGYIIEAEAPIYVSVRMNAGGGAQAGALVSKGLAALGDTFRIGSFTNENPQSNYLNFVSIMATEDNTQVTFDNLPSGLIIKNYSGTTPVTAILNKGESYTIATNSYDSVINRDGLIGCLVNSDKPIVVNCGSANGSFSNGTGRDYGIDQIVDLSKVGTEYIFVRGDGNNDWENVLIVAHSNNTSISINGNATTSINADEYYVIEGNQYSANGNMYVSTSQPVFAYQGIGATTSEANQGMFFVPPLSCETRGNLDNIAYINNIGSTTYSGGVSIVTKIGATVTINNTPISNFSTIGPSTVTGKSDYVTYKVLGLNGNVSVQCDDELYCAYFNYNGAATSGSFYSGFPTAPEINFDTSFVTLGICIGNNLTLEVANMGNFDSIEWFFDDGSGSGFVSTGSNALQYVPIDSGTYKLIGKLNCSGLTLESLEVPVSICPDDIDNDGIPDNIDIDNDNDGILNCTESNGNQEINLLNSNGGTITVGNYTYTGLVAPNGNVSSTSFIGTADGTFMSETPSKNGTLETSVAYDLNFNKKLNLLFEYATSTALGNGLLTNDEEFIIRVPNTKTITLLDPDDQLLVDTNFDGVYETGITQISAFEIRFKLNGTSLALGTGTFSFSANGVDAFTYIHKNTSDTNSNQATFKLTATCVANDNDFDGIEDALDLDSDNDGIPDFIENTGILQPLSGVDVDFNGLDDMYDIAGTPLDTDGDTVPDFYDLDSDNDGITDLIETGQLGLLSDTDLNGIVDTGVPFGINGWVDTAETSPDSNMIGYTLNDLDGDTIFSYIDLDSDGDGCSDVIEAGFSDGNNDDFLGDSIALVDLTADIAKGQGLVINARDGYTLPNSIYLIDGTIIITTQPLDTEVCDTSDTVISVISSPVDIIKWELSTDDGNNWNPITDNALYSGSSTSNLNVLAVPLTYNNYKYRAFLNRTDNICGIYSNEITLTVNSLPTVNNPSTYSQCDDASNDGQAFFNLTLNSIKEEINSNYITEGLTFKYYKDQNEALSDGIAIANPASYQDALGFILETVWIRVENTNGCLRVVPLTLEVTPSSAALDLYNPNSIYQCDDGLDLRDGVSTFDLTAIQNHITNVVFSSINVTVYFYETQLDAELEINEIINIASHENSNSRDSQNIWVRVKSDLGNNCLGLKEFKNLLIVESLPYANPVTMQRQCDYDTSDSQLSYPFDTSQIESILLGSQNPADVTITYYDENGNMLPSPLPNPFITTSQIITIRVTNNVTSAPDGPCYDEITLEFIVDVQPAANPVSPQIVCDGDADDIDNDGLYPFDTSTYINTILQGQTGMEVYFDYVDEYGNLVMNSPSLPNPLISGSQKIQVEVINPINTSCRASTTIELTVNPLPEFSIDTPQIVCSSDPTFTVILDPLEDNPSEVFDYEWTFQDGTQLSNTSTLSVSTPGTYSVTLTKTDGTGCSRTKDVFVNASELATITKNDISIIDISDNNSLIITDSGLGLGDYEYALEDASSTLQDENFFNYQDDLVFNHIKGGLYKLYVRDKNGCGTTFLEISIIGYPKFFTPNNDGNNDFWQIQGLSSQFQPNSNIFIFDRYGKLLKQLNPLSNGWDGTFNGHLLPNDDYWFKILLEDGRDFMGHFTLKR